jgi:phosphate:Na+ symporter
MLGPTELFLNAIAGLGLFFVGVKMVGRNLNALASEEFRRRIKRARSNFVVSAALGGLAGFVTQSGRTTSFIMASFVRAGLIDTRHALTVVLWANFGCTLIVSAAVFPIHLFALFLLGAAGVCIAFERPRPMLNAANATFGLALMLFGLRMMSASAEVLTQLAWFAAALDFVGLSLAFAFLVGLGLTVIAQSHMSIVLITVTLAGQGLFDFNQTLMMIYGAHAGSSIITLITGAHFQGQARQPVVAQVLYNLVGIALFLILFAADQLGGQQLMRTITAAVATSTGAQAAMVAVIFNTVTPLLLTAALPALHRVCARLSPRLEHEDLSRPKYLHEEVAEHPGATLILADREQLRLLRRLPELIETTRGAGPAGVSPAARHAAFGEVAARIQAFQRALVSRAMTGEDTEWLLNQQKRQELLNATEDACHELCQIVLAGTHPHAAPVCAGVVEALDTALLTAVSAMETGDPFELDLLETMTRDRGPAMEAVRKKYLNQTADLPTAAREQILQVTSLFERAMWSLGRFGALLRASPAAAE